MHFSSRIFPGPDISHLCHHC